MYSREEIKTLTDKVLNLASAAKAEAVELRFDGGERSATRWANSTITTNLVRVRPAAVHHHQAGAEIRNGDDARIRRRLAEVGDRRSQGRGGESAREPEPRAAGETAAGLHSGRRGAAEDRRIRPRRTRRVGQAVGGHLREEGCPRRRLSFPRPTRRPAHAELRRAVRVLPARGNRLHPHLPHAERRRLGLVGHHRREGSVADQRRRADARSPSNKAVKSQKPRAIEPGRYTTIHRAASGRAPASRR